MLALLGAAGQMPGAAGLPPEAIWRSACAYCHQGSKVGPPVPKGVDAETVRQFVRNGVDAMPPFHRSEISDVELDALAAWLKAGKQTEIKAR